MKVGIFTNKEKDIGLAVTKRIAALIRALNAEVFLFEDMKELGGDNYFGFESDIGLELMLTVGGDGTILRIAEYCARFTVPILGVNLGKLGFLAEVEKDEQCVIEQIIKSGAVEFENRTMLEVNVGNSTFYALNEAVVCRESHGRMILIEMEIDGVFVEHFYCDGFIIATPTGSTAYSLSAGGPILSPASESFVLTPINSHSLYTRPMVISDKETVSVKPLKSGAGVCVMRDGIQAATVRDGETVRIRKAANSAPFVMVSKINFYSKLLKKLDGFNGF